MAKRRKGSKPKEKQTLLQRFPNLLIGITIAVIVLVIGMVALNFDKVKSIPANNFVKMITGEQKTEPSHEESTRTYLVKEGDSLWSIAESAYGSGFNAYDIAKANHIDNPSVIEPGQRISLPYVQTKEPTKGEITENAVSTSSAATNQNVIRSNTYTIVHGDCLWTIAERKYGDGMMWSVIARANNLSNPDLIFSGNTLSLP